jgi:hypothetical protein
MILLLLVLALSPLADPAALVAAAAFLLLALIALLLRD